MLSLEFRIGKICLKSKISWLRKVFNAETVLVSALNSLRVWQSLRVMVLSGFKEVSVPRGLTSPTFPDYAPSRKNIR